MPEQLWIAVFILAGVIIYVFAKVRMYMRQSDAQWNQVDKTKLKEWQDDED